MPQQDNPQTQTNFDAPGEVVADPSLSTQEKAKALEGLEQDARQLAIASNEGMSGGEPTTLAEVLDAEAALAPTDFAYELVLKDLETQRRSGVGDPGLIAQTVAALEALRKPAG